LLTLGHLAMHDDDAHDPQPGRCSARARRGTNVLHAPSTQRMSTVAAMLAGFIRPAGRRHRVDGREVYATAALVEELEARCWEDWEAVVKRLALGAVTAASLRAPHANAAHVRWRGRYLADDGLQLPVMVISPARPEAPGSIWAMLDGE